MYERKYDCNIYDWLEYILVFDSGVNGNRFKLYSDGSSVVFIMVDKICN